MSSKQKKNITITTAVILILALGLAGTFAASGSADSSGNIEGQADTSIFLHDDFNKDWTGDVRDRDVYVENTGDTSVYVRMRLDEFMRYGGKKLVGGDESLTSTWKPHKPAGKDVTDCGTEIHDYFTIQMGNDAGIKYKPQTKNAYDPAITDTDKTETTSAANIILIEDYLKAETEPESCWVLDTADGYAYWHTRLQKGKATGLILNSITNTGLIDESYYYGINVKAEAVTETDLTAWFHGNTIKDPVTGEKFEAASTNAIRLLKNMSPKYIEITQEMKNNGASDFDSDGDGYLTKKENTEYEAEKGVTPTPELTAQEKVAAANVGDTVNLKNDTTNHPYGETTDWIILSKTDAEATLITKNMVTTRQYHTVTPYLTWPKSDIRGWLNSAPVTGGTDYTGAGYLDTLGTDLKQVLKEENLKTAKAYDDWTEASMTASADKVWMMTETGNSSGTVAKNPGDAALMSAEQLKCSGTSDDAKSASYWWLRSPGAYQTNPENSASRVSCSDGSVSPYYVDRTRGVRPAVTIKLK